jgi:hypothetical protein
MTDMTRSSHLELTLERIKSLGNLRLEYLKRFHQRSPVSKAYSEGTVHLHVHYLSGLRPYCASYGAVFDVEAHCGIPANPNGQIVRSPVLEFYKRPVLVHIGEPLKPLEPVVSVVWLKPLEGCYMKVVESLEVAVYPSVEVTFSVFDRELCHILDRPTVQPGKFRDEVVKGRAEVIGSFSNKDSDPIREDHFSNIEVESILIPMPNCKIELLIPRFGKEGINLKHVFFCPPYPFISSIQRVGSHSMMP